MDVNTGLFLFNFLPLTILLRLRITVFITFHFSVPTSYFSAPIIPLFSLWNYDLFRFLFCTFQSSFCPLFYLPRRGRDERFPSLWEGLREGMRSISSFPHCHYRKHSNEEVGEDVSEAVANEHSHGMGGCHSELVSESYVS